MHRVGGGVPVRNEDAALFVEFPPVGLVARIAVHRIKAGRRIGVHIVGFFAELPGQIHPDQRAGVALVVWEGDLPHRAAFGSQSRRQLLGLGRLAAAVQPFQHNQFSPAHTASPFSAAY